MSEATESASEQPAARWQPLSSRQRRVAGVLIEKAKTTDTYPLTLNSLRTGCNQKSNRSPQMDLTADVIDDVLDELRAMGAVAEVQGDGRVPKYRHLMYEWLGVDKYELAVMAELLLRGEQTVGELRGRASRMEAITDLGTLRPILRSLMDKNLLLSLTPEGRGQIVTHGLYREKELDALKGRVAGQYVSSPPSAEPQVQPSSPTPAAHVQPIAAQPAEENSVDRDAFDALESEVIELREQVADLTGRLEKIETMLE